MSFEILVQIVISGVLLGGLYTLVAFGLSLIYGVARILNMAHGTLLAIAGILASGLYAETKWNPLIIIVLLIPPFLAFGYGFHAVLLRPLSRRNPLETTVGTVLVTVGALIVLSDVAAAIAGTTQRTIPVGGETFEFGNIIVPRAQIWILIGVATLTVALHFFLHRSWFGRAIRAVTLDEVGATICGIESQRAHAVTFAVGSALAAVAGVLYVISFPVDPYMGFNLTVKAFTIIVVGGIGNLAGALIAGLLLGLAEVFTAFIWAPQWAPAISIILLLIILVVFPKGVASWRSR
jgi:branched-chain amino acid transport system permease protein